MGADMVHLCPPPRAAHALGRTVRVVHGTHARLRRHRRRGRMRGWATMPMPTVPIPTTAGPGTHGWRWRRRQSSTATTTAPAARAGGWRTAPAAQGTTDIREHAAHALASNGEGGYDQHRNEYQDQGQLNESLTPESYGSRRR